MKMIDIPPVWLAVFAGLAYWQGRLLPTDWIAYGDKIGAGLVIIGLLLMTAAFLEFVRHKTTVIPHQRAKALISSGIFAHSRNPIYLGDAFVLAGLCLRWEAALSLILVPAFIALITARFIIDEEKRLQDGFGTAFEQYCLKTRRWI